MKTVMKSVVVSILTFEASLLLRRTRPKIVAVTGNVGKTSTKDAIYHVLKGKVRSRKSEKSYNSEIGVPLSVLGLENAWSNPWLWIKNIIDGNGFSPDRFNEIIGDELEKPATKSLLRNAVEEKLKVLLLFKVVDDILKKSKLSDNDFSELLEEYRDNLAKKYGLS